MRSLREVPARARDWTYDFILHLALAFDEDEPDENAIGAILENYRCPKCHYLLVGKFVSSQRFIRCRCKTYFDVKSGEILKGPLSTIRRLYGPERPPGQRARRRG